VKPDTLNEGTRDAATEDKSIDAMKRASRMWVKENNSETSTTHVKVTNEPMHKYGEKDLDMLKKETQMSQNQTEVDTSSAQAQEPSFVASGSYSETTLRYFRANKRGWACQELEV